MIKLARSLVLPLALSTALFACDKGKSGSGGSGSGATGAAGAAAIAPAKGGLKGALAAMPKETEMVMGIDFTQLRKSDLFKKYEPMLMEKVGKDLEEFKQKCGFDPMQKLTGALVGMDLPAGGEPRNMTIFVRGLEKGPSFECLKKAQAESQAKGENKTATFDGDYVELTEDGQVDARGMFIDDTTLIMIKTGDTWADKAALTAAANAKDGEGLTASATFVKMLDEVKTGSAAFYVVHGNAAAFAQASMLPFKIKAVFGWVNVGGDLSGETHIRTDSADEANGAVGMGKMGMGQVKDTPMGKFLNNIKLSAKGADAVATFKFSASDLEEMAKMRDAF